MAGHKYINPNNLFENDVDGVDNRLVSSYRDRNPPVSLLTPAPNGNIGNRAYIGDLEKQRKIEQRMLDSSARSVQLLRDSESIGIATAKKLVHQRNVLENTDHHLDKITTSLTSTQSYINGIKSVFYGFKNYISGKSHQPRYQYSLDTRNIGPNSSSIREAIDHLGHVREVKDNFDFHPSTHLRWFNEQAMAELADSADPLNDSQRVINRTLGDNLGEMGHAITRLKGLGIALGDEIDQQNKLLDTITDKVERAQSGIGSQIKQMKEL